jgi:hypothetical protein
MLERYTFLEVPAKVAERVVAEVEGRELGGRRLALEPVRG